MADVCMFDSVTGCGCTVGWHNTLESHSKPGKKADNANKPDASGRLSVRNNVNMGCVSKVLS